MAEEVVDRRFAVRAALGSKVVVETRNSRSLFSAADRSAAVNRRADDLGSSLSVAPEYGEKGRATKP